MTIIHHNEIFHQAGNGTTTEGTARSIKVLMYHRVVCDRRLSQVAPSICVHADAFTRHLEFLERWGFTTITFRDYLLFRNGELHLPKKPIIITFDDGYLDTYEVALPILVRRGMKAVVFVLGDRQIMTNFWDHAESVGNAPLMNAHQVVELHASGFEIGSHSLHHANLSSLPREKAWEEVSRSRMLLEILLNAPVSTFAYPYGQVDPAIKEMVSSSGYELGCAVFSGPPGFAQDPYEIRRMTISGSLSLPAFAATMLTPLEYLHWAYWKCKRLVGRRQTSTPRQKTKISDREVNKSLFEQE